ncbi:MAG TPA: ATP-binding protein [Rhodothermales bacterium]|nr:ATP-binding protein [Rhodothermales bacterium]
MRTAGLLGIGCITFYVCSHLLFIGAGITWAFRSTDPTSSDTLWDKLLTIVICGLVWVLASHPRAARWGRQIVLMSILLIGAAWLIDDLARGSLLNSPVYLTLLMLAAVGTLPYRPGQMLLLCLGLTALYFSFLGLYHEPATIAWPDVPVLRRVIPLVIAAIMCTGISALLYRTRYEQYLALREREHLKGQILLQTQKTLDLERAKTRFFANISHEFRTPLTLILGPLQDLLEQDGIVLDRGVDRQLQLMRRNGLRLKQLIDQLLDLSKLEAGGMVPRTRKRDLVLFTRQVVQSFIPIAEHGSVSLQFHAAEASVMAPFDAEMLKKVLWNLLSNAFKFTPAGGKVHVSTRSVVDPEGKWVEVVVKDTGSGIPIEDLPNIFDRFYQSGRVTSPDQPGTGIGLSLARELVQLHGGSIRVESEPGFGSTFFVRLPLQTSDSPPLDAKELEIQEPVTLPPASYAGWTGAGDGDHAGVSEEPLATSGTHVVLVIEDHADMRAYLTRLLSPNYSVHQARDGREGLEKAREFRPDLVISDVMMPGLDGHEMCKAMKSDPDLNHIPVILLTARADDESKLAGLELGADDYLFKPFHPAELLARAENLVEVRKMLRTRFSGEVVIQGSTITVSSAEAVFLERVRSVIEERMANSNFGVGWLADEVGLSTRQLQRRLRASAGLPAAAYIQTLRLQRAAQFLSQQSGSVAEVAYRVGYRDASNFSKLFRQAFGVPPSVYGAKGSSLGGKQDIAGSAQNSA